MPRSPAPTTKRSRRSASSPGGAGATSCGTFVAEGEDLLAAADAAGWQPRVRLCAPGRGSTAPRSRRTCCAEVSRAGLGHARARRLRAALGAGAGRTALRGAVGRRRPRQRRHRAARGARVRRRQRRARPGHAPTRTAPKAVRASMGAIFAVPVARVREPGELPGPRVALVAARRPRARRARSRRRSRWSSAPSAKGCRTAVVAACDAVAHIPIAARVAQRRDGGDGRPVRG